MAVGYNDAGGSDYSSSSSGCPSFAIDSMKIEGSLGSTILGPKSLEGQAVEFLWYMGDQADADQIYRAPLNFKDVLNKKEVVANSVIITDKNIEFSPKLKLHPMELPG